MVYWPALDVDANTCDTIEIKMKVNAGNTAAVYFTTIDDKTWDGNKLKTFNLTPGNEYVVYNLDMSTIGKWSCIISQIRLDPTDTDANIEIDYIRIIESPTVPTTVPTTTTESTPIPTTTTVTTPTTPTTPTSPTISTPTIPTTTMPSPTGGSSVSNLIWLYIGLGIAVLGITVYIIIRLKRPTHDK